MIKRTISPWLISLLKKLSRWIYREQPPALDINRRWICPTEPWPRPVKFYGPNDSDAFERDFGPNSAESIAAQIYFQQEPNPTEMGIE